MIENATGNVLATEPLSALTLAKMDAYWRAGNSLSVGQIYLRYNPQIDRSEVNNWRWPKQ